MFGPELRRLRLAAGLTPTQLASSVHYSKGRLSKIETGQKRPTAEFARLCDAALDAGGSLAALVPVAPRRTRSSVRDEEGSMSPPDSYAHPIPGEHPGGHSGGHSGGHPGGSSWSAPSRRQMMAAGAASVLGVRAGERTPVPSAPSEADSLTSAYRELLGQYRRIGQMSPPGTLLPVLAEQTRALQTLSASSDTRVGRDHLALSARFAEFTGVAARARQRDPFPPGTLIEQPAPPVVERRELHITRVPLPSAVPDYDFLFSARVRWCPVDPTATAQITNPGAPAVEAVFARARTITWTVEPFRSSLVQHELNGALGVMAPDRENRVQAMALDVVLTLSEADQERLDRLAAIRKDEAVWEHQRRHEQNKREYLSGDVLTSTGSAVVWWLAKNDDHVEKTVKDIGLLARLSSAANNSEVSAPFRHLVPEAFPPPPVPERPPSALQPDKPPVFGSPEADVAGLIAEAFRRVGFRPGDDESLLIADQLAMAIAPRDAVTAEEIRRRFGVGGSPTAAHPHSNGSGPPQMQDAAEGPSQPF
ncbi:helix-turn-helix domain-containing protein [Streptomyces sp. KM273126]|nr:helix-turn-helix domain-containing protein [Streptomyces sp. KM273126]